MPEEISEDTQYILNQVRKAIWSGFYDEDDVMQMIEDLLDGDADEDFLRAGVDPEFAAKAAAERDWPAVTDCDRLDQAFERLSARGILALQNAGYTSSDGHYECAEQISKEPGKYYGYCFYHGQDLERAVNGEGLWLGFDHINGDVPEKAQVGATITEEFEKSGFGIEWDGDPQRRMFIPNIQWQRRFRP